MNIMINIYCRIAALFFILSSKIIGFYQMSIFLSKFSFNIGIKIRYYFYQKMLKHLGNNVLFSYGVILSHNDISIGDNVRFGPNCTIGLVDFGNNILVAQSVHFLSGKQQHGITNNGIPMNQQPGILTRVTISDDVWVGASSVIMTDIPTGCVIGAGSVVVGGIEKKYSIYGGNPAKFIKEKT